MKKLMLAIGLVVALAAPAGAETRFRMSIGVTTPRPGAGILVKWQARCVDDGVVSRSHGRYRTTTPDVHRVRPPDLSADSCQLHAHVWNETGQGVPRLTISVTP